MERRNKFFWGNL
jgi:hypothetical protein